MNNNIKQVDGYIELLFLFESIIGIFDFTWILHRCGFRFYNHIIKLNQSEIDMINNKISISGYVNEHF
jgi:hypothetical protein